MRLPADLNVNGSSESQACVESTPDVGVEFEFGIGAHLVDPLASAAVVRFPGVNCRWDGSRVGFDSVQSGNRCGRHRRQTSYLTR